MYIQILRTSVIGDCNEGERDELAQRFRGTVGLIIALFNSLSTVVLAELSPPALSKTISTTLNPLKSVLKVPEDRNAPIQLLHPSSVTFSLIKSDAGTKISGSIKKGPITTLLNSAYS